MSSHVFENFFSRFSGKGAKRKRKVSECLHDVFLCVKNPALVIFFHYATKEISQWKLNVTYVFFLENEGQTSGKNSSERCLSQFVCGGAKVQVASHRSGYRSQATGQVTGHTQKQ